MNTHAAVSSSVRWGQQGDERMIEMRKGTQILTPLVSIRKHQMKPISNASQHTYTICGLSGYKRKDDGYPDVRSTSTPDCASHPVS